jgi:sugar lactone lactonase YvrE
LTVNDEMALAAASDRSMASINMRRSTLMMKRSVVVCVALAAAAFAGMTVPAGADVIVAGYAESSILRYAEDGTRLDPIVPPGGMSGIVAPAGIEFGPDGFLYVSNQGSAFVEGGPDYIARVDPLDGTVTPFIRLESGYVPAGLRFGPDGNLYVCRNGGIMAPPGSGSVDCYDGMSGKPLRSVVTNLTQPTSLLFDSDGVMYVSNFGGGTVVRYDGASQSTLIAAGSGGLATPAGLQIGPEGSLYVVDLLVGAVRIYDLASGDSLGDFIAPGGALNNQFPSDLLFDRLGNLLVADLGANFDPPPLGNVKAFDGSGAFIRDFATGITGASQLLLTPE